jgi:hypothetical protein
MLNWLLFSLCLAVSILMKRYTSYDLEALLEENNKTHQKRRQLEKGFEGREGRS